MVLFIFGNNGEKQANISCLSTIIAYPSSTARSIQQYSVNIVETQYLGKLKLKKELQVKEEWHQGKEYIRYLPEKIPNYQIYRV